MVFIYLFKKNINTLELPLGWEKGERKTNASAKILLILLIEVINVLISET